MLFRSRRHRHPRCSSHPVRTLRRCCGGLNHFVSLAAHPAQFRFFIFPCIQFSLSRCICSLILPSSHHMILFSIFPFDQYKLFIAIYKNGTMILRVAFPICTNCPPSKNTCFNGIFAYVRNAMARSAPIEDATTSSISLIPCLSLLFDFFKIYCLFLHRNFYHLKTILQKFLFEGTNDL